jgi:hypothetical protein
MTLIISITVLHTTKGRILIYHYIIISTRSSPAVVPTKSRTISMFCTFNIALTFGNVTGFGSITSRFSGTVFITITTRTLTIIRSRTASAATTAGATHTTTTFTLRNPTATITFIKCTTATFCS